MSRAALTGAVAVAWLCVAGTAAAAKPETGFAKPRAEILAAVKTIGVLPLVLPAMVPDPGGVAERYEAAVAARLEQSGFKVVKAAAMREIQERLKQALRSLYDPVSGRPIPDKVAAFREYANNEYLANNKVDATLWIGLVTRRAEVGIGSVKWDGVAESPIGHGKVASAVIGMLTVGGSIDTLPVLSLSVALRDARGVLLYSHRGGLQLLAYVPPAYATKPVKVSPEALLADRARDARALAIALDPLILGKEASPDAKVELAAVARPSDRVVPPISQKEFVKRYHALAIAPLVLADIEQRADVQGRYHDLIAANLARLGFTVAGDPEYAELWAAEAKAAAGFYDKFSGRLDQEKLTAARQRAFAALQRAVAVDAVVLPTIENRRAKFRDGYARWDGTSEALTSSMVPGSIFDPSGRYIGELPALSLAIRMSDADDQTIFEGAGGVQLAERFGRGGIVNVPETELFTDPTKNAHAVETALAELAPPKNH